MARLAWYKPDHKSFGEFILSERMRDVTADVAHDIMGTARADTPRSRDEGTHMADEYRVNREAGTMKVHRARRVMVTVINDSDHAAAVEFGSKRNRRRRMLGRAGAMYGDFKPEGGLTT